MPVVPWHGAQKVAYCARPFSRESRLIPLGFFRALVRWWNLDPRLAVLLFGLWLVKDLVLFPVLRIGYETGGGGAGAGLVGASGVAQDDLRADRVGYVRVGAELWRARLDLGSAAAEIQQGTRVRVTALRDLTLIVEALPALETSEESESR